MSDNAKDIMKMLSSGDLPPVKKGNKTKDGLSSVMHRFELNESRHISSATKPSLKPSTTRYDHKPTKKDK